MTFSRRRFLSSTAATAALGLVAGRARRARAQPAPAARNLVIVLASGGWDITYAVDPKPALASVDAPAGAVEMFGDIPIFTHESRPAVGSFFAAHGAMTCVVNGINVRSIAHTECLKRVLTGTASEKNPDLGAIAGHELGTELPIPYLVLGDTAFAGPLASSVGRVGTTNQIKALLDPADAYPPLAGQASPTYRPSADEEADIRGYLQARAQRERATRGARGYNQRRIDDFVDSLERGDALRQLSDQFGERGVTLALDAQLTLAMDVLQGGMSRAVMVDSRLPWDTHVANASQNQLHEALYGALDSFATDLAGRPGSRVGTTLLDETLVVVMSEMSRTPRLNAADGKDHWPVGSAVLFGAGVAGGKVVGATTDDVSARGIDMQTGLPTAAGVSLTTESMTAGLLSILGVDPSPYFPGVEVLRAVAA